MEVSKILENSNMKITNARKTLIEIFEYADRPICYEDIKDEISMDKATFYRNMTKFEEEKILHSFESNDKKRYFELQKTLHAHFICLECNTIECLKNLPNISLEGYKIQNIILKGICKKCIR